MKQLDYLVNLSVPNKKIDVVLDTDTANEVDDQFALAYLIKSNDKLNLKAIYAAPFTKTENGIFTDRKTGMEKSYAEINKILELMDREDLKDIVHAGATDALKDKNTPVTSDAAEHLVNLARKYSSKNPLYVICIAASTNIASALLLAPDIAKKIVIVWLGGHAHNIKGGASEFNMAGDLIAAQILFKSEAPLVQLPCKGVVTAFGISEPELDFWFKGKNKLCDYLCKIVKDAQEGAKGKPWTRIIWDVTAVAWLLNDKEKFMESQIIPCKYPQDNLEYSKSEGKLIRYITFIGRDTLMQDLIEKLTK